MLPTPQPFPLGRHIQTILLLVILCFGAWLRITPITNHLPYTIDNGTDLIIADHIVTYDESTFSPTHPKTIYMENSPLYNNLVTVAYQINPSLMGVTVWFVAAGITLILIGFVIGNTIISPAVGLLTALFLALSPVLIQFSTTVWQPSLVPFFTLLSTLCLVIAHKRSSLVWVIVGISIFFLGLHIHLSVSTLFPALLITVFLIIRRAKTAPRYARLCIAAYITILTTHWIRTILPLSTVKYLFSSTPLLSAPTSGLGDMIVHTLTINTPALFTQLASHVFATKIWALWLLVLLVMFTLQIAFGWTVLHMRKSYPSVLIAGVFSFSYFMFMLYPAPLDFWNLAPYYPLAYLILAITLYSLTQKGYDS